LTEARDTVLIIDDGRASREALATMVEALGYAAFQAESGLEGLRLLREVQPSLVLLDLVMPDIDGFKIAAAIKAQPRFVPVILLTAMSDLESKRRGQAAGADDFLTKPVSALELQIRIAAMLRIRGLTVALDRANQRLDELAHTDGLTGVSNRRRFEMVLAQEHRRAMRYKRPLALLTADIDHFKRVNDTQGHAVGDEVLRQVATALSRTLRDSDKIARIGGEEFVVLAPETNSVGAVSLGDRLRKSVEVLSVQTPTGPLSATVSVGVAAWDGTTEASAALLLKVSDEALYEAKGGGRNRVVLSVVV
jgi:diguanylate cyclase (GGDEF)-like protein